jgi:hypothetical protein
MMARGKFNGGSGRYPFRRVNYRASVRSYGYADISKSEYPTFIVWIVRIFGIPRLGIFQAARKIYSRGGNITKKERERRVKKLVLLTLGVSVVLGTAAYIALSFLMCHGAYKSMWQSFFLILLFLFFAGSSGMAGLLGLDCVCGGGSGKLSPVEAILDYRGRHVKPRRAMER